MLKKLLLGLGLIITTSQSQAKDQIDCLTTAMYHEARGESENGKLAVADVVLNRTKSKEFPDTICKVVYDQGQFSWVGKKRNPDKNSKSYQEIRELALKAKEKHDQGGYCLLPKSVLFFDGGGNNNPRLKFYTRIGGHMFYSLKGYI